eukprot:m.320244 g.320244  ORF g.320244 m.320244 type:complete len:50 (+) comp16450_c0_seq6:147-296(+)
MSVRKEPESSESCNDDAIIDLDLAPTVAQTQESPTTSRLAEVAAHSPVI